MNAIKGKTLILAVLVLFSFLSAGCKEDPLKQYGNEVIDAMDRTEAQVNRVNLKNLQSAVKMYYMQNGKYPETLEDLGRLMNSRVDLSLYDYDPETGRVTLQ
jgi:hypothetical protein